MSRRLLPIGIQSLRALRERDGCHFDKTPLIRELRAQHIDGLTVRAEPA